MPPEDFVQLQNRVLDAEAREKKIGLDAETFTLKK